MKKNYQEMKDKCKAKFAVLGKRELWEVPLAMGGGVGGVGGVAARWSSLTGEAGLRIISTILENEVAVRWGRQPDCVMFGGQK